MVALFRPPARPPAYAKECGGSSICEHGKQCSQCKEYGGGSFCTHGRRRNVCKEYGGKGFCEHGRQHSQCKDCGGGSGHVTTLEAPADEVIFDEEEKELEPPELTADEVFDEEEEPPELLPAPAGPRGGKRKC